MVDDISYDDVVVAVDGFLPLPAPKTLDLRQGSYRYEVTVRSAAVPEHDPREAPATAP
jgi:hypothetical protein